GQRRRQPPLAGNGAALWSTTLCLREFPQRVWNLLCGSRCVGNGSGGARRFVWGGETLRGAPRRNVSTIPWFGVCQSQDRARGGPGSAIGLVGMEKPNL